MKTYILYCHTEPMGDTLYGDTLKGILDIFNEDYDTDYSTMEEFNESEHEWAIYEVLFPDTQA